MDTKNGKSIAKYQVLEDANLNILQQYVRLSQNNNDIKQRQELKISALTNLLSCVNNYVIDKYNQLESTNSISFNELIELVANGTQHNPSLVTALKSQYPIAFIDEFQDTDMLQWQIFNNLYVKPQYGVLIVVGDPKQAIYRFRGADIDVYLEARETIKSNNLQINPYLELTETIALIQT